MKKATFLKILIISTGFLVFTNGFATVEEELPTSTHEKYIPKYYGENLCSYPGFTCVEVKRGDTWDKLFPDKKQREIVKRLNRTNIALHYRTWIVVPENLAKINHLDLSPFPHNIEPSPHDRRTVIVNLDFQAFGAYDEKGNLVHWGPVSGGMDWCDDIDRPCRTVTGDFKLVEKKGIDCESNKFPVETAGGAPMPYCMFFYRGFALHASTLPGYNASHGCIRLFTDDAKWLNEQFAHVGTRVIVTQQ